MKIFGKLIIILSVIAIIIAGGAIAANIFIKPPSIPKIGGNGSSRPGLANSPDSLAESIAPPGVTDDDRRKDFYTFLIVGLDIGWNTDTIMVASYDAASKEANIIGIPRDSLVNAERKVKKINAAFGAGAVNGGGNEGGIAQLKREIKTVIGFIPDFYMIINLKAFEEIVDAVGGVEVTARMDMKYYDPTQNLRIDIPKGTQKLDGSDALKFARYRRGSNNKNTISDYERIENQQQVIKSLLSEVIKPSNWLKYPEFVRVFSDNVVTDLSTTDLLWFIGQAKDISGADALTTYTMPTTGTSGLPMYYELLDKEKILELVNSTINPYTVEIKPEDVDIIKS
ncbi:MAG: LCP family protein [Oscillospiraceae bacterium]|nr:LCP family protein [Oscillospiraceae bacterium]